MSNRAGTSAAGSNGAGNPDAGNTSGANPESEEWWMKKKEKSKQFKDPRNAATLRCDMCATGLMGQGSYDAHCRGKKHEQKLKELKYKNRNKTFEASEAAMGSGTEEAQVHSGANEQGNVQILSGTPNSGQQSNLVGARTPTTMMPSTTAAAHYARSGQVVSASGVGDRLEMSNFGTPAVMQSANMPFAQGYQVVGSSPWFTQQQQMSFVNARGGQMVPMLPNQVLPSPNNYRLFAVSNQGGPIQPGFSDISGQGPQFIRSETDLRGYHGVQEHSMQSQGFARDARLSDASAETSIAGPPVTGVVNSDNSLGGKRGLPRSHDNDDGRTGSQEERGGKRACSDTGGVSSGEMRGAMDGRSTTSPGTTNSREVVPARDSGLIGPTPDQNTAALGAWLDEPLSIEEWRALEQKFIEIGGDYALGFKVLRDAVLNPRFGAEESDLETCREIFGRIPLVFDGNGVWSARAEDAPRSAIFEFGKESVCSHEEVDALLRLGTLVRTQLDPLHRDITEEMPLFEERSPNQTEAEYQTFFDAKVNEATRSGGFVAGQTAIVLYNMQVSPHVPNAVFHPKSVVCDPTFLDLQTREIRDCIMARITQLPRNKKVLPR